MQSPGHNIKLENVPPITEDDDSSSEYEEDRPAEPPFTATMPLPLGAGSPGNDLVDFIVAQQNVTENRIQREEQAEGLHMTDIAVDPNNEDSSRNLTEKEVIKKISYITLLTRYSTKFDVLLMIIGLIAATGMACCVSRDEEICNFLTFPAGAGVVLPLMTIIFGNFTNEFSNPTDKFKDTINT